MAKLGINTGTAPNDNTGDSLILGAIKINSNFNEIYNYLGDGTTLLNATWNKTSSGINTLSNVGVGTTNPTSKLTVSGDVSVSGVITASSFSGNATSSTYATSAGIATYATSAGIATNVIGGIASVTTLNVSGVSTLGNTVVGGATTQLIVNGDARITGILTIGTSSITLDGSNNVVNVGSGITINGSTGTINASSINLGGTVLTGIGVTYITAGSGISVDQNTGNVTITVTSSSSQWVTTGVGIHTTSNVGIGTTDPTSKLTVEGNVRISGVSTLSSNVSVGGTISVDGGVKLVTNNSTIVGTSGTVGEIKQIGGAPFFYDGSAWREFVLSSGTPVSVPADTEWDNVVFRATFDDNFTDAKFGATPSYVSSGSTIAGAAVKIGTGAYRNAGGGSIAGIGVSYPYRSEYDFTGSWTIEFWLYLDNAPDSNGQSLISQISTTDTSGNWTLAYINYPGVKYALLFDNENSSTKVLMEESIATWPSNNVNQWVHYALVREGSNGSLHLYRNGVESASTYNNQVIDNQILHINGAGLVFGAGFGNNTPFINSYNWNSNSSIDAIFDDVRISCGVGTAGQRYTSIGISTYATFTPPTTALPTTGTLSSYVQPPGDKYGEIGLGTSPTWRGTSGVTVSQQSSGNYRVSFATTHTNANDYFVLTQPMDQGFASYVGVARSTTHVDFAINKESDNAAVDTGSLSVQIKNHI